MIGRRTSAGRGFVPLLLLCLICAFPESSIAFKNNQHEAATNLAASNAGEDAPDILKFKPLIVGWSFGINYQTVFGGLFGKPAEQLAHVEDQTRDIGTVFNNNGNFLTFENRVRTEYELKNYSNEEARSEGAYVLMGSCLHLIEDQASAPHAANVLHQENDKFEGPLVQQLVDVNITRTQGSGSATTTAYKDSLRLTQDRIDQLVTTYLQPRYWSRSDELRQHGNQQKSTERYTGQYEANLADHTQDGVDPQFTGSYDEISQQDIFQHTSVPFFYGQQGTQATDFAYNFLLKMSKSLRPLVSGLTMTGAGGTPVIVNTVGGNKISFKVIENRNANVKVKAFVQETGQAIVAENSVLRIATGRGVNGAANETPLGGPTTWDNLATALFDTKADDLTLLPFEADFELTWKGVVAGGAALADGNYTLCVTAQDSDQNSSAGPAEGRNDTCVLFRRSGRLFPLDRLG